MQNRRSGLEMQTREKCCRDANRGQVMQRGKQGRSGVETQTREKWCRDAN
jgi:hypothetical protein